MTTQPVLAVEGGKPVRSTMLPYAHQLVEEQDVEAVLEVLRADRITTGPRVEAFEEALAEYVGSQYAVAFSSGTAALHGAVFAAGLRSGDEGITTPLTFCATANCLLYQGARPVFADVQPDTLTIEVREIERRITKKTRAILPVDYAGHPADLEPVRTLAERRGLVVIEDACHALGAVYRGKRVGALSHMTVFSFHPVKHITTGEGGMVTTDDSKLVERLRRFRNHGITRPESRVSQEPWYYEMAELGYNFRLSDLACALGCSQLKRLGDNLSRRRQIVARYQGALGTIPGVIPPTVNKDVTHAWHLYPIRLDLERLGVDRGMVVRALRAENIGVQVHFIPVHLHPYYRQVFRYTRGDYPVAEHAYEQLISLPMFHGMRDHDVEDVIRALEKVLTHLSRAGEAAGSSPAFAQSRGR